MLAILATAIAIQIGLFFWIRFILSKRLPLALATLGISPVRKSFQTFSLTEKRLSYFVMAALFYAIPRLHAFEPTNGEVLLITRAYDALMLILQGASLKDGTLTKQHLLEMSEVFVLFILVALVISVYVLPLFRLILQSIGHKFSRSEIWAFRLFTSGAFFAGIMVTVT